MKKTTTALATAALMLQVAGASQAFAQDASKPLIDFADKDRWIVRLRAININPDESSTTSIGGSVSVDNQVVPELDFTYFFTKNIAAELILATAPHDVGAINTALGNLDLGDVRVLPPTLTAQYHFNPDGQLRPYAGVGISYIHYYDEDTSNSSITSIDYDDGFGYALQAGFDYGIDEHWAFNADIKKIYHNVDVSINGGAVTADVDLDPWVFGVGVAYRF